MLAHISRNIKVAASGTISTEIHLSSKVDFICANADVFHEHGHQVSTIFFINSAI